MSWRYTVISCCLIVGDESVPDMRGGRERGDALEVPTVLLVNENEIEVVPRAELLVDIAEGGSELKATEEQPDRNCLSCAGVSNDSEQRSDESHLARERRP